jgi:hypothetical protein
MSLLKSIPCFFQLLIKLTSVFSCEVSDTVNEGNSEYNLDEPTMEEKLATMNLVNRNDENADTQEQSLSMAPPSADSVNILLKQALRADDNASLLNCLYNRDEKVFLLLVLLWLKAALNFVSVITLQYLIFLNFFGDCDHYKVKKEPAEVLLTHCSCLSYDLGGPILSVKDG